MIDTHQHFWRYDSIEYDWIDQSMEVLRNDRLPEEVVGFMESAEVRGSIAVQARRTPSENEWLATLAASNPFILGVVGWVDLCAEDVAEQLDACRGLPKFVGVREILQAEPPSYMARSEFRNGLALLHGLTYDLLLLPEHLEASCSLVDAFPNQKFVLDHLAKPDLRRKDIAKWKAGIADLAKRANVSCKLSGLVTETAWKDWSLADFKPVLDHALETFGAKRLMFGSDWPVCVLSASYSQVLSIVQTWASELSSSEREDLFENNAVAFYLADDW